MTVIVDFRDGTVDKVNDVVDVGIDALGGKAFYIIETHSPREVYSYPADVVKRTGTINV